MTRPYEVHLPDKKRPISTNWPPSAPQRGGTKQLIRLSGLCVAGTRCQLRDSAMETVLRWGRKDADPRPRSAIPFAIIHLSRLFTGSEPLIVFSSKTADRPACSRSGDSPGIQRASLPRVRRGGARRSERE